MKSCCFYKMTYNVHDEEVRPTHFNLTYLDNVVRIRCLELFTGVNEYNLFAYILDHSNILHIIIYKNSLY